MPLLHNYHTHTTRCKHANGSDREYVEYAIQCGLQTLGFSDHTPYPFANGYHSTIRMECEELEGYVDSVLSLQREYKDDVRILLGLEVEYYPEFFDAWRKLTEPYPFDYFLLGQHFVGNEYDDLYSGRATDNPETLRHYVDQTIAAMQTGMFLYLAHPDLIHYRDTASAVYTSEMRRLCEAAKELRVPLEINLLGVWDHRQYPNRFFWRIAGEVGNDVVLGSDAHQPEALCKADAVQKGLHLIEENNLHWIEKIL